jgi:hypothetical protein
MRSNMPRTAAGGSKAPVAADESTAPEWRLIDKEKGLLAFNGHRLFGVCFDTILARPVQSTRRSFFPALKMGLDSEEHGPSGGTGSLAGGAKFEKIGIWQENC